MLALPKRRRIISADSQLARHDGTVDSSPALGRTYVASRRALGLSANSVRAASTSLEILRLGIEVLLFRELVFA